LVENNIGLGLPSTLWNLSRFSKCQSFHLPPWLAKTLQILESMKRKFEKILKENVV
jgi:hypothetical protein